MTLDELQIHEQRVVSACSPGLTGYAEALTWFFISLSEMLGLSLSVREPSQMVSFKLPQLAVTSVYAE